MAATISVQRYHIRPPVLIGGLGLSPYVLQRYLDLVCCNATAGSLVQDSLRRAGPASSIAFHCGWTYRRFARHHAAAIRQHRALAASHWKYHCSTVCSGAWQLSSVLAKEKLEVLPPLTTATVLTVFAGILLSVVSLLMDRGDQTNWDKQTVWATLFLGVASSALGYFLYYWLLQHMRPYQLAARYFLMPMVALTEGKLMLGEEITAPMPGGMLLILCSIFLVLRERPTASKLQPVMKAEESVSLIG